MQKDSAQAKISLKVVGGLLFFDSHCTMWYMQCSNCAQQLIAGYLQKRSNCVRFCAGGSSRNTTRVRLLVLVD